MQIYSVARNVLGALGPRVKVPVLDSELKIPAECLRIVGALDAGSIIEQGSNANGRYTKFADGTMICTCAIISTTWNIDPGTTASLGAWTFPAVFAEAPVVSCAFYGNGADFLYPVTMIPTTSGVSDYSLHNFHTSLFLPGSSTVTYKFIAVGRWKA